MLREKNVTSSDNARVSERSAREQKPLPLGATATTAASGGNREELLGQRPARRKRSAADAGCRNSGSVTVGDGEGKPVL